MKFLIGLAAAALVASGTAANAASHTYTISLDGHCDVLTLNVSGKLVAGTDDPACEQGFGGGVIGNVKKFGGAIIAGVQFIAQPNTQLVFQAAWPLVTGGPWILYATTDGVTLSKLESGTYTVAGADASAPAGGSPIGASLR